MVEEVVKVQKHIKKLKVQKAKIKCKMSTEMLEKEAEKKRKEEEEKQLVLRDRGTWQLLPTPAPVPFPALQPKPGSLCSQCVVDSVLSDCTEGQVCEQCFSVYCACPVCDPNANCWLRLAYWSPNDEKRLLPPFVPTTKGSCPLMPPHIPDRCKFVWQCPNSLRVFASSTGCGLKEVIWREGLLCNGCKKLSVFGSRIDGYRCFNANSRCGGGIVHGSLYEQKKSTEEDKKEEVPKPKQKRADINHLLLLKAKTGKIITADATTTPIVDQEQSKMMYGRMSWIFRCPNCADHPVLEEGEEGFGCFVCWSMYKFCEYCNTSVEGKFDAQWMTLVSWSVPDTDDEGDDGGEEEKRITYPPPWRPLDSRTGKVYEGIDPPSNRKRFYGCDSSIFSWLCPLCSATCTTCPD